MEQSECANCGNTYTFDHLVFNEKTGDYFCSTCYCKNKRRSITIEILYFILGALIATLIFDGIPGQFSGIFG